MRKYSTGQKGAAVVIHQMFFILMLCSLFGAGYCMKIHRGIGLMTAMTVAGLVGSFVTLAFLTGICGRRSEEDPKIYLNFVDQIYTDLELLLFGGMVYLTISFCNDLKTLHFAFSGLMVAVGTLGYLADLVFLVFYLSIVRRAKDNSLFTHSLCYQLFCLIRKALTTRKNPRLCTRKERERSAIRDAIEAISSGALDTRLNVEDFHGQEKEIAEAVNNIRAGLSDAIMDKIKNERMKADLITNVSHDIKTPLTSIVNYVDLLKRENLENDKARSYIRILDEKSQRLKQLTEDLVEASKISSGNIHLDMQNIDMVELLYQTGGEFNERFEARGLTIVTKIPHKSVKIRADGRQLYRAIESRHTNAAKHALENTRVYVELEEEADQAVFTIKNVSQAPLPENGIDGKDLTDRFVRGEESRTTEGSGLGLSIAKNLTNLMGGEFVIQTDGDLFAAKITFSTIPDR